MIIEQVNERLKRIQGELNSNEPTDATSEQKAKAAALWCQYVTPHGEGLEVLVDSA